MFKKASKSQIKLRLALIGVSGGGKTFSALSIGVKVAKLSPAATQCLKSLLRKHFRKKVAD
jgi:hypothetical protein